MAARYLAAAAALLLLLVLAVALFADRGGVAQPSPSPSATPTSTPATTPTAEPTATSATSPSPTARPSPSPSPAAGSGTITGEVSYPSESRPELEVYAIDVNDSSRWFSVTTPEFVGQGVGGTGSPSPDPGKVYSLQVPPGTYHVVAYIKDSARGTTTPGIYSQYVLCGLRASCSDHTLIEVTVAAGETREDIDPADWYYQPGQATYPPRPTPR